MDDIIGEFKYIKIAKNLSTEKVTPGNNLLTIILFRRIGLKCWFEEIIIHSFYETS